MFLDLGHLAMLLHMLFDKLTYEIYERAVNDDEFVYIDTDWLIDNDITTWRRPGQALPVFNCTGFLKLNMNSYIRFIPWHVFSDVTPHKINI